MARCGPLRSAGAREVSAKANSKTHRYDGESAVRLGRAVLGCLLEAPGLWKDANSLEADHFLLDDHRKIFGAIALLHEHECDADIVSVADQLGEAVAAGDLGALVDGAVPENLKSYVRHLRESARDRQLQKLSGQLVEAATIEDRRALLDLMREVIEGEGDDQNWRGIFHTYEEFKNAPPLRFAIDGFLQEAGVTLIGGLAGHGKGGHGFFRLVPGANVPSPAPIAAACQDSLFGDLTPEGYPD
jgi:hypothetical protein